jgi:predicted DNA-binding transcriptional regulator YafY
LAELLAREGYECSKRTVERDLERLGAVFTVECEVENGSNYWWREKGAVDDSLIVLTPTAALAMVLALPYLEGLLAPKFVERLDPWVKHAKNVLDSPNRKEFQVISNRVISVTRGPTLKAPDVDALVLNVIYQALADRHLLEVEHVPREANSAKKYQLMAAGIVNREGVLYLVASTEKQPDKLRQFALHRTLSARTLPMPYEPLRLSEFQNYVEREFSYPTIEQKAETIFVELAFTDYVGKHLFERPLSDDQQIEFDPDGGDCVLTATVKNNQEFRWWLLGFGSNVEVMAPAELRQEIAQEIADMHSYYDEY